MHELGRLLPDSCLNGNVRRMFDKVLAKKAVTIRRHLKVATIAEQKHTKKYFSKCSRNYVRSSWSIS